VIAGCDLHGIQIYNSLSNWIGFNWIGISAYGVRFENKGYSIVMLSGASFNFLVRNAYGAALLGDTYFDTMAIGNAITL